MQTLSVAFLSYVNLFSHMIKLSSFITPDSIIATNVSISRFFLSDTTIFRNINNAEVNLWENGTTLKEKRTFI